MRSQDVDGAMITYIWDGDSQLAQYSLPITGYASGSVNYVRMETPIPNTDGTTTAFTLSQTPISCAETVFLNGVAQDPTNDYSLSSSTVTMVVAPAGSDQLSVSYFWGTYAGYHRMSTPTPALNGSTTAFTISATPVPASVVVYLNGVAQHPGTDYSLSGSTVTFTFAPASTDKIRVSFIDSATGMPSVVTQSGLVAPTPAVDGVSRMFSFSGQSGTETVYLNGIALRPDLATTTRSRALSSPWPCLRQRPIFC